MGKGWVTKRQFWETDDRAKELHEGHRWDRAAPWAYVQMKFVRITAWSSPDSHTLTVAAVHSLTQTVDEILESAARDIPGLFYTFDIFELDAPADVDPAVVLHAGQRFQQRATEERDMAIMYFWDAAKLKQASPRGLLAATQPAPLSADQVEQVLVQLARHPNYRHQIIASPTKDGFRVSMQDGVVTRVRTPGAN